MSLEFSGGARLAAEGITYFRGRVALAEILRAFRVGPGDEVVTQAFTCVAVPEGIRAAGATPVYADLLADGVTVDPRAVADRITPRTRAVIAQHTFGIPSEMTALSAICAANGLLLIEDCAHTVDSRYGGATVGTIGDAAFYSFEWGKPHVVGIGGMARVRDVAARQRLAEAHRDRLRYPPALRTARLHAQYMAFRILYRPSLFWTLRSAFRLLSRVGVTEGNYQYDPAALADEFALRMAPSLDRRLARALSRSGPDSVRRLALAASYAGAGLISTARRPVAPTAADPVLVRFPLFVEDRERLAAHAREQRVETALWYETPVHPCRGRDLLAVGYHEGSCPRAEEAARRIISLPLHSRVGPQHVDRTVAMINRALS